MLVFVLSYYIILHRVLVLFYYYLIEACLLANERQQRGGSGWEGKRGGTERSRGRKKTIVSKYYVRNKNIFNKMKTKERDQGSVFLLTKCDLPKELERTGHTDTCRPGLSFR